MTEKMIRALMIKAEMKPIVIFCPTPTYAESLKEEIKGDVFKLFPTLINSYINTGHDIFIKGHETITVCTVSEWNEMQKKRLELFSGYAYCSGCTIDDIYGVKNLMYEPERLNNI